MTTLKITGMTCDSCAAHVKEALEKVPGVQSALVSYPKGTAQLAIEAGTSSDALTTAVAGLGFLSQYEGLFIGILLPMFAGIALLANAIAWLNHRQWRRTALGTIGPILVLAAVFLMRAYGWQSGGLLYVGLALMVGVSVWDFISPAHRRCGPDSCELPEQRG